MMICGFRRFRRKTEWSSLKASGGAIKTIQFPSLNFVMHDLIICTVLFSLLFQKCNVADVISTHSILSWIVSSYKQSLAMTTWNPMHPPIYSKWRWHIIFLVMVTSLLCAMSSYSHCAWQHGRKIWNSWAIVDAHLICRGRCKGRST